MLAMHCTGIWTCPEAEREESEPRRDRRLAFRLTTGQAGAGARPPVSRGTCTMCGVKIPLSGIFLDQQDQIPSTAIDTHIPNVPHISSEAEYEEGPTDSKACPLISCHVSYVMWSKQ